MQRQFKISIRGELEDVCTPSLSQREIYDGAIAPLPDDKTFVAAP